MGRFRAIQRNSEGREGDREEGGSIVGGSIVLEPSGRAERSVSANLYRLVKRRISQNSRQTSAILGAASP